MNVTIDAWAWLPTDSLTNMQVAGIKASLTVQPRKFSGVPGPIPQPIRLYVEKEGFIGVPRAYFMARKKAHHNVVDATTEGRKDLWEGPLTFVGNLRPDQQDALTKVSTEFRTGSYGGIVRAVTGWGKSPRIGTPVLKYDGTIVPVENLRVGDLVMGPDSTPRTVLVTNRGHGPLYRITPTVGDPWECNDVHILTLVDTKTNNVVDINLQDYLKLSKSWKHRLKQFSPPTGVDFPAAGPLPLDPYFLGVWYGDGTKALNGVAITKPDKEIQNLCARTARKFGLKLRVEKSEHHNGCPVHHIVGEPGKPNPLLDLLRDIFGSGENLPPAYLTASRDDRRAFLAGWLDSDGYHNNGSYEVVQRCRQWANGVAFLARSLGIRATVRENKVNGKSYWRVKLAGDFAALPLRIARKIPRTRLQRKCATRTGFTVERIEDGEYVGIVLDGDHRYLLGDFTVTHNTVWSCAFMAEMKVPTLVVVHKEFLVNQWKERIEQFLPGTRVGIVQQDRCEYRDYGVVIGMIHSLVGGRDYGEDFWNWPGLIITDECFPAGTLIATAEGAAKPIETFQVGDAVLSAVGQDTVARTFRKEVPVEQLRLVELEDGSKFICTANHPVLSATDGWIPAGKAWGHRLLTAAGCADTMRSHGHEATEDTVALRDVWETRFSTEGQEILLPRLYGRGQEANGSVSSVRVVWDGASEAESVPFLREQLSREVASEADVLSILRTVRAHEGVASSEPLRRTGSLLTHEGTQSHAEGRSATEGFSRAEGDEASSSPTGREWEGTDRASTDVVGAVGCRLDSGVCGSDTATSYQPSSATFALQVGPSASELQSSCGSGRREPQDACGTEARSQEVRVAAVLRVVSVTLPQPADFEQLGWGSVGDTGSVAVYNLSVVRHPSYVLHDSKVLVHNCHRIGAETWSVVPTRFKARWRLGVSATPRRKDGCEEVFFSHIGKPLYASVEQRMTPKIRRVWTDFRLVQTASLNPQLVSKQVLLKFLCGNTGRNKAIVEQMLLAVAAGRKPIVLSERLNHLDALSALFQREWQTRQVAPLPSVGFYVGGMKEEELEEAAKAQVIFATRQFAEEGLDIPALDTIFLTTPMSDVEQAVGRILRPCEGKKEPVVVDFRDDKVAACSKAAVYRDKFYSSKGWTT